MKSNTERLCWCVEPINVLLNNEYISAGPCMQLNRNDYNRYFEFWSPFNKMKQQNADVNEPLKTSGVPWGVDP